MPDEPVAIVSAAFVLPGGIRDPEDLRAALEAGRPVVGAVPPGPRAAGWPDAPIAGWVAGIEDFDPELHRLSEAEALLLDPRHRLLLDTARAALHAAGGIPDRSRRERCGVFLGLCASEYRELCPPDDPRVGTGTESSAAAGRIAHTFGLGGPALVVDTACASALVALNLAVSALHDRSCDTALVGAAQVLASPHAWERMERTGILSPSARCRPFDAAADGTVRGEGGGMLVLRRLSEAQRRGDPVLAVILGSAVRHDGAAAGLTVPNGPAQEETLRAALDRAGRVPSDVGWIEAHATGTALGDPIEAGALERVYGAIPVTASKGIFGHLEAAGGLLGILAASLALRAGRIPPVGGFATRSPRLSPTGPSPGSEVRPIRATVAGVSAFGLAGTNAHVLLGPGSGSVPSGVGSRSSPRPLWVARRSTPPAPTIDVRAAVAAVLGGDPARLPADRSLFELGLDSVGAADLARRLGVPVSAVFEHPTIARLDRRAPPETPVRAGGGGGIAIVATACRFPGGADDLKRYWELLLSDRDPVGPPPPDRAGTVGGWLPDIHAFDAERFGWSAEEARQADPQQRLWMEVAAEALERAPGLDPDRTGLYVGAAESQYLRRWTEPLVGIGNEGSFVAGRAAHALGLGGPAMTLNTACSASLVAVHLACRALADGECDAAVAGGVSLLTSADAGVMLGSLGVLSPSGRCRTFDAAADGYVRGEGCGAVVLVRLADAVRDGREVLAVIRGSAVGHDGRTGGVAVPGPGAWRRVVADALRRADVGGADVGYVEVHGSATPLGDPIEARTLGEALAAAGRTGPVWTGSAKTRLGHLEQAAGIAGLLKVVAMLRHGVIAPNLHFSSPNPHLPDGVVRVPTVAMPWDGPRIAGISAFGISGTTAHLVVAGAEPGDGARSPVEGPEATDAPLWLPLSGRDPEQVRAHAARLADALAAGMDPHDIRATLAARPAGPARAVVVAAPGALGAALVGLPVATAGEARIALLFTGAGPQRPAMARELPGIAAWIDRFEPVVRPLLGPGLHEVLCTDDPRIADIAWLQVATVVLQLALAERLSELVPVAVAGHSFGEIAAASVAGVLSPEDAVRMAALRGLRMREVPPGGAMLAVRGGTPPEGVDVAAINSPVEQIWSGPRALLEQVRGDVRWLALENAWHSRAVDPIRAGFASDLETLACSAPVRTLITSLDGAAAGDRARSPAHWAALLRQTVRFDRVVAGLADRGCDTFVEVGPHPVLLASVGAALGTAPEHLVATLRRDRPAVDGVVRALAACWAVGAPVRSTGPGRIRADVPPAPLRRTRYHATEAPGAARVPVAYRFVHDPVEAVAVPVGEWRVVGAGPLARQVGAGLRAAGVTVGEAVDGVVFVAERTEDPEVAMVQAVLAPLEILKTVRPGVRVVWVAGDDPAGALTVGAARALGRERPGVTTVTFDAASPVSVVGWRQPELVWRDGRAFRPRATPQPMPSPSAVSGRWLVLGGFGALGLGLAHRLLDRGASQVIVAGPRPRPVPAPLVSRVLDVRDPEAMRRALDADLQGVVLAAGVLDDAPFERLDPDRARRVLEPKVLGAALVAASTVPRWVLLSSAAGWFGSPGQVPYAAANTWLDAVALRSGGRGRSVALGPVAEAGMAARRGASLRDRQLALGIRPLALAAALDALEAALGDDAPASFAVVDADPERLRPQPEPVVDPPGLEALIRSLAGPLLPRPIPDTATELADLGLDSLGAVSLRNALAARGIALPLALVLRGPSVAALAAAAADLPSAVRRPVASAEDPARLGVLALGLAVLAGVAAVATLLQS